MKSFSKSICLARLLKYYLPSLGTISISQILGDTRPAFTRVFPKRAQGKRLGTRLCRSLFPKQSKIEGRLIKQSGWRVRSAYIRSMRGQFQSIIFFVNTAILHAPLAYCHTQKEVMNIPSRKFHSKKFYIFQNTAIYLKLIVFSYDLHNIITRTRGTQIWRPCGLTSRENNLLSLYIYL